MIAATSPIEYVCAACNFPIGDDEGYLGVPFVELSRWPDLDPNWRALHSRCIDPERDVYGIPVSEIRDADGLLRWTVHLMSKNWLADSNWRGILSVALSGKEAV